MRQNGIVSFCYKFVNGKFIHKFIYDEDKQLRFRFEIAIVKSGCD